MIFKNAVFFVFLSKNTHKTHEIVKVAVINDNNNFAPSLFRSLCEFVGDCFGPRYFSPGTALPQKNTSVQNNHLRFHTMTSKKMVRSYYCLTNALMDTAHRRSSKFGLTNNALCRQSLLYMKKVIVCAKKYELSKK